MLFRVIIEIKSSSDWFGCVLVWRFFATLISLAKTNLFSLWMLHLFILSFPMTKVSRPSNLFSDQRAIKESSSETLLCLAEPVLTLNCFSFVGNYYKQTNGVAMGTKMVDFIKQQFFGQYNGPKPELYGRSLMTASALYLLYQRGAHSI